MARRTYPGSLDRHGPSWRWRVSINGERHTYTVPDIKERDDAVEWARDKYKELKKEAERAAVGLPTKLSVSELFKRFKKEHLPTLAPKTRESYKGCLKALSTFFVDELGDPNVSQVRAAHVRRYLSWRRTRTPDGEKRKTPLSDRTLQLDHAVLRVAFQTAVDDEYLEGNPVAKAKAPTPDEREPVILTEAQYAEVLEKAKAMKRPMLYTYIVVLAETGMRCESEALWLRWEDVDFSEGFIHVESGRNGKRTKTGKGRWIPMTSRLRQVLQDHFARFRFAEYKDRKSEWIFHHRVGRRTAKAGDRLGSLRCSFEKACEKAKLPAEFTTHDLRHRRATTWIAEGKPVTLVKEALGHADLATTMKYTHLAKKHLRVLVEDEQGARRDELRKLVR